MTMESQFTSSALVVHVLASVLMGEIPQTLANQKYC